MGLRIPLGSGRKACGCVEAWVSAGGIQTHKHQSNPFSPACEKWTTAQTLLSSVGLDARHSQPTFTPRGEGGAAKGVDQVHAHLIAKENGPNILSHLCGQKLEKRSGDMLGKRDWGQRQEAVDFVRLGIATVGSRGRCEDTTHRCTASRPRAREGEGPYAEREANIWVVP